MNAFPLVSVVMCTYNGSQFVDEQIDSILKQDYEALELIIVDDWSTDETWQKLNDWAAKHPAIRIEQNEQNLGYNRNFEKAIQLAKGEFIALSDQDDVWMPAKISKLVAKITSSPGAVLAHSKSVKLADGKLKYNHASLHYHFEGNDTRRFFFFNHIMGHDTLFKRDLVRNIVPIPNGMSYDWWIAVVATCCGSIVSVDEYLVHHRIHMSNSFFSNTAASKKKELDLPQTLEKFLAIPQMEHKSRAYLERLIPLLQQSYRSDDSRHFNLPLFLFLLKNRNIVFGHKRRFFPFFSYVKNALKYAGYNFKGKGMSI